MRAWHADLEMVERVATGLELNARLGDEPEAFEDERAMRLAEREQIAG
ncbi:MAG: hypothetical protein ACRDKX_06035 [Solirubrobacterales bacterium]